MSSRTNHIDQLGSRHIGRRNKPTPRSAPDQCHAIIGGSPDVIFVKRKDRAPGQRAVAMIPIIKGGQRCKAQALVTRADGERRCADHINHI
jgi:hypothetical protein